jgi:hypothetical protein
MFAFLSQGPAAVGALQALLRRAVSPAGAGGLARFLAACVTSDHAGRGLESLALDLLERGADPYANSPAGDPPLALAVRLGWLRVVERLVAYGVNLDARDSHGMTALHLAAALGRESALKSLIAQGADPDMRAADGQTPLGVALSVGPPRSRRLARLARLAAAGSSAATVGPALRRDRRRSGCGASPARPGLAGRCDGLQVAPRCCVPPAAVIAPSSICCSRAVRIRVSPRVRARRRCPPR